MNTPSVAGSGSTTKSGSTGVLLVVALPLVDGLHSTLQRSLLDQTRRTNTSLPAHGPGTALSGASSIPMP